MTDNDVTQPARQDTPGQPGQPDVSGAEHPIIGEAVAWLAATDTVPLTRAAAENLLPQWRHYPNLTDRERQGVLNRFPADYASWREIARTCAQSKPVEDLVVGDWFIEGTGPAKVVAIGARRDDRQHFTLHDDTPWSPWAASYFVGERVTLLHPGIAAQLVREAAQAVPEADGESAGVPR